MQLYKEGQYAEARICSEDVLRRDCENINALLLGARANVHLGDKNQAKALLERSRRSFGDEYSALLDSWVDFTKRPEFDREQLGELDEKTDMLLQRLRHNRSFGWIELLGGAAIIFVFAFIMVARTGRNPNLSNVLLFGANAFIFSIIYYRNPILAPIWPEALRDGKSKLYSLSFSLKFWRDIGLVCLFMFISWGVQKRAGMQVDYDTAYMVQAVFLLPIIEELYFRGFLYSVLEKIAPTVAIVGTILLSALYREFSSAQLALNLILTVCFARERTILAPIMIHTVVYALWFLLSWLNGGY
jgi:membrane protease YdiL (CAAX protease family)